MSRPLEICIVTADIVGPIRNGGIGTAYYSLALALARAGHRVTVLYALGQFCEVKTIAHWQREYAAEGVTFVPVPDQNVKDHGAARTSYAVYRWLKDKSFDVVHCHEWRGIGFYTALAKGQGLCLQQTVLVVGGHSPGLWHLEGMNETASAELLEADFMERESVARADVLWSPSAHMVRWMRREGWALPRRIARKPYILLDLEAAPAHAAAPGPELVFFGRLETRKGLDLFCDALDRLVARGLVPPQVTFLGKPASVDSVPSDEYLKQRSARWPFSWRIMSGLDRDAAMTYLRGRDRVAVLPSRIDNLPYTVLECLGSRIPFVAAATGGIPEMVRPRDRERVLCDLSAESLAAKLAEVHERGLAPAALRVSPERTIADWLRWHEHIVQEREASAESAAASATAKTSTPLPRVSVCVTHRNRPAYLGAAIDSIRDQDYPAIEVILVDDGSDEPAATAALDALEPEFARRGWTILRQPNRYPGAARNAAVEVASGDYILFMDDDNLAEPHEVRTLVQAAEHSGADILTCLLSVFQGRALAPTGAPLHIWPFLGAAIAPGMLRNVFGDANALIRRSVFDRIGGFTEDFGVGNEDWEFFARAVLRGMRLEVVPEPLVRYRQSPSGVNSSTSQHANRMRALRPYLRLLPPHLRPMAHLARQERVVESAATQPCRLDHVQRAVVFGSGQAGKLAMDLAARCGWSVPFLVDNNPSAWNQTAHGRDVRQPASLSGGGFDLVIVASLAGKPAIFKQLSGLGMVHGEHFVHFLDPVQVGSVSTQVRL